MSAGGETALFQNLKSRLQTLEGAKGVYAEILDLFAANLISERNLRAMCYAMSGYLSYIKMEKDFELEARIKKLEEIAEELNERN